MIRSLSAAAAVMALLGISPSYGAEDAGKIASELAKQEAIYGAKGEQTVEGYTVDRALDTYAEGLASGFDRALAKLGPADRWLDIGAGQGNAILDYYSVSYDARHGNGAARTPKAQAVAISIEDRRTQLWQTTAARLGENRIQYLFGKRFGQYSGDEIGRFQLISDVIGGFSYTNNISTFMEKVLGALDVNGTFYTVLQDVQRENGANKPHYPGSPFLTELVGADGSQMKVCEWLKQITCVQVTCEPRDWTPPTEAYRVTKTCENVSVPATATVHYAAGTPPERRFVVQNPRSDQQQASAK